MCVIRKTLRDTSSSFDFGSEPPGLNKHSFDLPQHRLSEVSLSRDIVTVLLSEQRQDVRCVNEYSITIHTICNVCTFTYACFLFSFMQIEILKG